MENTVQETPNGSALPARLNGTWGSENIDGRDLELPKILLMQGQSKMVQDPRVKARPGELRDSLEKSLLATDEEVLRFIPFASQKHWITNELVDEGGGKIKRKYVKKTQFGPENADWPWKYEEDGKEFENIEIIEVFCLLPDFLEEGKRLPFAINFRGMSYKAGKKLCTFFAALADINKPPASKIYSLSSAIEERNDNTYYVFDVAQGEETPIELLKKARKWYDRRKTTNMKADDSDLSEDGAPTPF